jgi:hypothetical protein
MIRFFCGVSVCVALFLSFARWSFDCPEGLVAAKDVTGDPISMQVERERENRLTEQFEELNARIAAKDGIADRLLAGEMTLAEAAAYFGRLYEQARLRTEALRVYAGSSEGEILCRQVIAWVENKVRFEQSAEAADRVVHRLEAELRRHLAEQGTVELPQ